MSFLLGVVVGIWFGFLLLFAAVTAAWKPPEPIDAPTDETIDDYLDNHYE